MALNPHRESLTRMAIATRRDASPFHEAADAALARFRTARGELERQVRRGELTPKVARRQAEEIAASLRSDLLQKAIQPPPVLHSFSDRLMQAAEQRKRSSQNQTAEALQRETNRLLRRTLVEQQIVNRTLEFEGRTFVRPLAGGVPAPTLESLLSFHAEAEHAGDDAAQEWARRQLEGLRPQSASSEEIQRIDAACERPDRVQPRMVARYVEALTDAPTEELERFVDEAIGSGDASACCAAFVLAREAPVGEAARWVRLVLESLGTFPDAALGTLRAWDAEACRQETESARSHAEYLAALAETEIRGLDTAAPTADDLRRQHRMAQLPAAAADQPIGLKPARRGLSAEELAGPLDPQATETKSEIPNPGGG